MPLTVFPPSFLLPLPTGLLDKRAETEPKSQPRAAPAAAAAAEPQPAVKEAAGQASQSTSGARPAAEGPVVKMEVDPPPSEEAKDKQTELRRVRDRQDTPKALASQQKKAENSMWV